MIKKSAKIGFVIYIIALMLPMVYICIQEHLSHNQTTIYWGVDIVLIIIGMYLTFRDEINYLRRRNNE